MFILNVCNHIILMLLYITHLSIVTPATSTSATDLEQLTTYYQPALIGFRCESTRDLTPEGVSVIEANRPVKLTLFGESFTKDTIIAFTTEFEPDPDEANAKNSNPPPFLRGHKDDLLNHRVRSVEATRTIDAGNESKTLPARSAHDSQSMKVGSRRRFEDRRRTRSKSFDCTDYDRVVSYRLNEEDILSPNVAQLTIALPELDSSNLYYFCLKQPKLTALNVKSSGDQYLVKSLDANNDNNSNDNNSQANDMTNIIRGDNLVWVHQGDEWWLTLKVEAPTLSVASDCILMILLLFLSAVTSGLNLGLMSLDMNELAVISSCGDQRERAYARTIEPLRKRGNYLLCSLLLGNVMVNATLTVILEQLTSGVVAVIGSTLAIVVLGEIVPQAFCARQGLAIGAKTIYLTYAFMMITFPLSYPISVFLDYVLGQEEGHVYDRERLMEFIRITGHHTQLDAEEVAIISGAMKLKNVKAQDVMTRIEDVFMLPINCKLDRETIRKIIEKGYSRIPVYEFDDRKQICALILAKDLALLDPDDHTPIAEMLMHCKHPLIFIDDETTLDVALNEFKTGKSHMAVVRQIYDDGETDKYYEAIGVVTLEDVIEEVLQVEINDETDTLSDNRRKRRRADAQVHVIDSPQSVVVVDQNNHYQATLSQADGSIMVGDKKPQ